MSHNSVESPGPRPTPPAYRPGADRLDRLYDLLPAHIRVRDIETGEPLRALLRVLGEMAVIVEDDIARLYENAFIETCDPWAVPYVAAIVGYEPLPEPAPGTGEALDSARGRRRSGLLVPRLEAAYTLANRRRKGTLAVLEELAQEVAGFPARAVEFRERTAVFAHPNFLRPDRSRSVDVRDANAIDLGVGPFGTLARSLDLRHPSPDPRVGRGGFLDLGLYIWPGRVHRVDKAPARRVRDDQREAGTCRPDDRRIDYTFSILGHQAPLYQRPLLPPDPTGLALEDEPPGPIRPLAFSDLRERFYSPGRSLRIWRESEDAKSGQGPTLVPVPVEEIRVADLDPRRNVSICPKSISVDPRLGRIALIRGDGGAVPRLWVTYHHGAPADIGAGDYPRHLDDLEDAQLVVVRSIRDDDPDEGAGEPGEPLRTFRTIDEALDWWHPATPAPDRPLRLIVEIRDDAVHLIGKTIRLARDEWLVLRAGRGRRPLVGFLPAGPHKAHVQPLKDRGGHLELEGLLIADTPPIRADRYRGDKAARPPKGCGQIEIDGPLAGLTIRHCTLVPGRRLGLDGRPLRKNEPALLLRNVSGEVTIDRSVVGPISELLPRSPTAVESRDAEPPRWVVLDSVIDNVGGPCPAIGSQGCAVAFTRLRIERSTVLGRVEVHAVELAQDCLLGAPLLVARRRRGCVRFCHVPAGSRTPARYRCQPDLALAKAGIKPDSDQAEAETVAGRVRPRFRTVRYGHPEYLLLADDAPDELRRGASDEGEMGAYHDEYIPQRRANLFARLAAFTPAGSGSRIIDVRD